MKGSPEYKLDSESRRVAGVDKIPALISFHKVSG